MCLVYTASPRPAWACQACPSNNHEERGVEHPSTGLITVYGEGQILALVTHFGVYHITTPDPVEMTSTVCQA